MPEKTNTALIYLYRDGANYKNWGRVVLSGEPHDALRERIRNACQRSELFVARQIQVPEVFLYTQPDQPIDERTDHGWHEFHALEPTEDPPDDTHRRTIVELVDRFETASEHGWNVREPWEIIEARAS